MATEKSGSAGHLRRFSAISGRDAPRRHVAVLALMLALIGIGRSDLPAIAEDGQLSPAQDAASAARTDLQTPRSTAPPRLYVPVHPADPAQVDKQFAIGQDTVFGVQSEELIRSGHRAHDRNTPAAGSGLPAGNAASRTPAPGSPEATAK